MAFIANCWSVGRRRLVVFVSRCVVLSRSSVAVPPPCTATGPAHKSDKLSPRRCSRSSSSSRMTRDEENVGRLIRNCDVASPSHVSSSTSGASCHGVSTADHLTTDNFSSAWYLCMSPRGATHSVIVCRLRCYG